MTEIEYKNSLYELSEIFKILDKDLIAKIPKGLKKIIENEKATNYNFNLDYSKKLSEQKLSKTTEVFLTALHLKYWCDEEEKKQILNAMRENENKHQEKLEEQYNPDNLFKSKPIQVENNSFLKQPNKQQMLVYNEENIFKRIFNKIRSFLKNKQ